MKIQPINQQVYLQEETEQVSKYGIILQDTKVSSVGTIYAIEDNEYGLKVGDRVLFSRYAVEDVDLKDEDGKKISNLKSLHIDAVHAILT